MPPGLDGSDLSAEERLQRLKTMVSRLLKDLRQREDELSAALERKEQLRLQLQAANDRLVAMGSGQAPDSTRESGDFGDVEASALRRRVKTLESALAAVAPQGISGESELLRLREQNEALLTRNAELELRVAELKAKTTFREKFLRELESSPSIPPASTNEHRAGASETPTGSPNGAKRD